MPYFLYFNFFSCQIYLICAYTSNWARDNSFMVIDTNTKTIKDVLYPNNSKVVYPLPSMLDRPEAVCAVSIPQQNLFILTGGIS